MASKEEEKMTDSTTNLVEEDKEINRVTIQEAGNSNVNENKYIFPQETHEDEDNAISSPSELHLTGATADRRSLLDLFTTMNISDVDDNNSKQQSPENTTSTVSFTMATELLPQVSQASSSSGPSSIPTLSNVVTTSVVTTLPLVSNVSPESYNIQFSFCFQRPRSLYTTASTSTTGSTRRRILRPRRRLPFVRLQDRLHLPVPTGFNNEPYLATTGISKLPQGSSQTQDYRAMQETTEHMPVRTAKHRLATVSILPSKISRKKKNLKGLIRKAAKSADNNLPSSSKSESDTDTTAIETACKSLEISSRHLRPKRPRVDETESGTSESIHWHDDQAVVSSTESKSRSLTSSDDEEK